MVDVGKLIDRMVEVLNQHRHIDYIDNYINAECVKLDFFHAELSYCVDGDDSAYILKLYFDDIKVKTDGGLIVISPTLALMVDNDDNRSYLLFKVRKGVNMENYVFIDNEKIMMKKVDEDRVCFDDDCIFQIHISQQKDRVKMLLEAVRNIFFGGGEVKFNEG